MLHDMTADYHRHGVIGRGVFQHPAAWSLGPMVISTRIYKKCSASFKSLMVSKIQLKNLGRSSTLSQTKHLAMKSFSLQDLPELNFSSETSSERNAFRPILGQQPHYTSPLSSRCFLVPRTSCCVGVAWFWKDQETIGNPWTPDPG